MNPELCIIAAMSENRVIAKDGKIPWHISEDLKRFKELTTPHPIIMGRKTFESIGRPLPNRLNIVVTHHQRFIWSDNLISAPDIEGGIWIAKWRARVKDDDKTFIIGGGQIYEQTINMADRLYLTIVEGQFEGDTYFPDYSRFNLVSEVLGNSNSEFHYKFLELER